MGDSVRYETAQGVATLTLDRPERLNAIVPELIMPARGRVGLASECTPEAELDATGEALARRVSLLPANQLQMMKLLVNQAYDQMGLSVTQLIGTLLDGAARHTPEGVAFSRAAAADVRRAVAERDAPFGDYGQERR